MRERQYHKASGLRVASKAEIIGKQMPKETNTLSAIGMWPDKK